MRSRLLVIESVSSVSDEELVLSLETQAAAQDGFVFFFTAAAGRVDGWGKEIIDSNSSADDAVEECGEGGWGGGGGGESVAGLGVSLFLVIPGDGAHLVALSGGEAVLPFHCVDKGAT